MNDKAIIRLLIYVGTFIGTVIAASLAVVLLNEPVTRVFIGLNVILWVALSVIGDMVANGDHIRRG